MSEATIEFQKIVWEYYHQNARDLPWRQPEADGSFDPYKILVSEIMLQQTQVSRVIPKYQTFLQRFPDMQTLAAAPLSDVLIAWSGLGYNRRARYIHEAAKRPAFKEVPWKLEDLTACKGIGVNTAAAVMVYTYNQPIIFIETNIRTVYIHHFFAIGSDPIADKDVVLLVEETLDTNDPREWYWALMDYGAYLKANLGNVARLSKHHTKQSSFEGSRRQIRGQVLRLLITKPQSAKQLKVAITDERLPQVLSILVTEKLIRYQNKRYFLAR